MNLPADLLTTRPSAVVKPFQLPYRQIPLSLFKLVPEITTMQVAILSLFGWGGNRNKTNAELFSMLYPTKKVCTKTIQRPINTLIKKNLLITKGKGKARTVDIPPEVKKCFTDVRENGAPYIKIANDLLTTPVSISRKIVLALSDYLKDNFPHLNTTKYIAKSLNLHEDTIYYHLSQPRHFSSQPRHFSSHIYNRYNRFILNQNKSIMNSSVSKETDKELLRSSSDANSYSSPIEDSSMNTPTPKPKPVDFSSLQHRSASPKKAIKVASSYLAELQSINLPHITRHRPDTESCAKSCRVIHGLKRGLHTILDDGAITSITKDLARYGVTSDQVTDIINKKWSPEERQELYQKLNNHYSDSHGYFGKIKKIDLATALFHPYQLFSPLLTAHFRPRALREKPIKTLTPVKPPAELENISKAILEVCNEKVPTFKFIGMLQDIRKHFDEEVDARQRTLGLNIYTWYTWHTEMVKFIAGECNDSPKWPFFKPGTVPFAEWEKHYRKKIRQEAESSLWRNKMKQSENSHRIQEYKQYLEGEGVFVSYEKAAEMYNQSY